MWPHFFREIVKKIQPRFLDLPEKLKANKIKHKTEIRYNRSLNFYKDNNKKEIDYPNQVTFFSRPGYILSSIGFWLGSFSVYPVMTVYLSRLVNLLIFVLILTVCLRLIPAPYEYLLLAYSLLPMTIHQVGSVSYDGFQLATNLVVFTFFVRFLKSKEKWPWEIVALSGATVAMVLVKGGYYYYLLIPFVAITERVLRKIKYGVWLRWFLLVVGLIVFAMALDRFQNFLYYFGGGYINSQNQWYLVKNDFGWFLRVLATTFDQKSEFYLKGFLGYFGWLDYVYPLGTYLVLVGMLFVCIKEFLGRRVERLLSKSGAIMGLLFVGLSMALLEFIFYISWTSVGAEMVEGVQGRYFLVLFPFFIFFLFQLASYLPVNAAKMVGMVVLLVMVGTDSFRQINKRFYDFSVRYKNLNELEKRVEGMRNEGRSIELVSLDKKIQFTIGVAPEDNINGFNLYFNSKGVQSTVPYRYEIQDSECSKVKFSGYFDSAKLVDEGVLRQPLKTFKPGDNALCVNLYPLVSGPKETYFDLGMVDGEYLFSFLMQDNEEDYQ